MKVHLVDGTYELFRHYFAIPSRRSPEGQEVAAVWGVLQSMLGLLREPGVTHVATATDHVVESFRNELFDGYKTGDGVPEDLMLQFPLVEEALEAIGVTVWPMIEFEADDGLASAASKLARRRSVEQVRILSPDKDLAQCVEGNRIVCVDRRRNRVLDDAGVREKFGVPPASIPDYLALVGDAADGIPGIPGFGAKTAARLLAVHHHVEDIPSDSTRWPAAIRGAARLAETLEGRREDALLYRTLATLRVDADVDCRLTTLRWTGVPRRRFVALCRRLGFGDLQARPHRWDE